MLPTPSTYYTTLLLYHLEQEHNTAHQVTPYTYIQAAMYGTAQPKGYFTNMLEPSVHFISNW